MSERLKKEGIGLNLSYESPDGIKNHHVDKLPAGYREMIKTKADRADRVVYDYISGMTDLYANEKFSEIFMLQAWRD